jgi:NitT/TauT family transport system substrate-binding protein
MKLTPFAKFFIAAVILGVVGYAVWVKEPKSRHELSGSPAAGPASVGAPADRNAAPRKRIVLGVNDFGGAYPLLLANDGDQPGPQSRFRKAGLDVEVRLIRGSKERLAAFDDGEVQVMLLTLDYLANLVPVYHEKGVELRSFLFVDWSRGNVGIVARPELTSIESLKKARIATTRNTPTHYLLLSLLNRSNLTPPEIEAVKGNLVFATKTPQAGELFARGEVDAVAIWEPHLSQAMAGSKGAALLTTETATNLIADVLFARRPWLEEHKDEATALAGAYFEAVQELNQSPARAVALAAAAFKQKPEEIAATLKKIKPATFADNRVFFGMDTEDCAHDRLFSEAGRFWQKEGLIKEPADPRRVKWTKALEALAPQHRDEKVVESFKFTAAPQAPALISKSVSIYFATGQSTLDPNAKRILDDFANTLAVFQNAYVRVEGNTDNVGARPANVALSKSRAQAVVDYLVERHRFEAARFLAVGNGPDAPVADNRTPEGRELNRRTDFKLVKNDQSSAAPAAPATESNRPLISGPLGPESVLATLKQSAGQFSACYTQGLKKQPQLAGRVVLKLDIDAQGKVVDAATERSTLGAGSEAVERCLVLVALRARFAAEPGRAAVQVKYPLVFRAEAGK